MSFQHAREIWADYPELVAGVVLATGITSAASVDGRVDAFTAIAEQRLATGPASAFPEIQAWRRTFARMGLKPTQYRCAAEALLRRFAKEGALPRIHPLVDLCNAVSLASAVPVAVFDLACVVGDLEVRYATGEESYRTFGGEVEHPDPREVIFADDGNEAHARRWSNRQSGHSSVSDSTTTVLIVAEAMHASAATDIAALTASMADEVARGWDSTPTTAVLTASAPRFAFPSASEAGVAPGG